MTASKATVTAEQFARLTGHKPSIVNSGRATLTTSAPHPTDRRFVMDGPSGQHTLLIAATDLERLNAHWSVFAAHAKNNPEAEQ